MSNIGTFLSKPVFSLLIVLGVVGFSALLIAIPPSGRARTADACSAGKVNATSVLKTYHLLDLTDGFGVTPTKDGGYLVTGDTVPAEGMAAPRPFVVKTDANGTPAWTRWLSSKSLALGSMSSRRRGRLSVQTKDGNFVMANDAIDFVDENKKELYGDILLTKLNPKGAMLWSVMLGNHSEDRPRKMWALPDGGVMVLGRFFQTGFGNDVADSEAVPKYAALMKIDKNGKVVSTKKLEWNAEDMERLADGSYIALADINVPRTEQPEGIIGPEIVMGALPTIIRLDADANVLWAKSMEMIPTEINAPTAYTSSSVTMGKTAIRIAGGDFRTVKPTPDGGFIAFGFDNVALTQGITGGPLKNLPTVYSPRPLVAVKVDANGDYRWTKKLTTTLVTAMGTNDFQVVVTADGQFVLMEDVIRDSAGIQAKSDAAAQKRKAFNDACEGREAECLDPLNLPPDLQPFADAENAAMKAWSNALASTISLVKTDADFNPRWIKQYDAERDLSGYGITATADKGVAIAANLITTKEHKTISGMEPYKEAALLKVDANGNAAGCASVADRSTAALEDESAYLVMRDMAVETGKMTLDINKKVKGKVTTIKNAARTICAPKRASVTPICTTLTATLPASSASGETAPPAAKTWALVNYENAAAVEPVGEKNVAINGELLPILNGIYGGQVKLKDSMESMWLTYVFPRPATRADVETAEQRLVALGYRVDESNGGTLNVSRVGRTLHLTFYIQSSTNGKVEVLF